MKNLEQFCVAAFMSAFIGVAFYYLTEDFLFLFFDFIGLIVLSVGIGIIAFVLITLYYRKKNKEDEKKAEEKRLKKEEKKRKKEELRMKEGENKKQKEENKKLEVEVAQKHNNEEKVVSIKETQMYSNHQYVDLGLPSGTLWSTMNIGAKSISDRNPLLFAWGEASPRDYFTKSNYKLNASNLGVEISGTDNDVATKEWGKNWQTPTLEQCKELISNTTQTKKIIDGNTCLIVKSKINDVEIVVPEVLVDKSDNDPNGYCGFGFWIGTHGPSDCAYRMWEWSYISYSRIYQGFPVRPVLSKTNVEQNQQSKTFNDTIHNAEQDISKEEQSNSFTWDYDPNSKTLTISGEGNMPENWKPWPSMLVINHIVISNGVLSISDGAFLDVRSDWANVNIDFGDTIQSIGNKTFGMIAGSVKLPNSIKHIGDFAFAGCNSFRERICIIIGDNIETIGKNAFGDIRDCEIRFKSKNPPLFINNELFSRYNAPSIIKVPIGSYKNYICSPIFSECVKSISEMDVDEMDITPEDIKAKEEERKKMEEKKKREQQEAGERLMRRYEEKKKADEERKRKEEEEKKRIEEEEAKTFDWDYDSNTQTLSITGQGHMPNDWHPWGSAKVSIVIIKDGVLSIGSNAFSNLNVPDMLKVDFGNTLQSIGDNAFDGLWMYGIYVFPDSLKSIGAKFFKSIKTVCFKSQNPPIVADCSLLEAREIIVPTGCLKNYTSSSEIWQYLADRIKEQDISEMHSSLELEAIEVEKKRQEVERKRVEEEQKRKEEEIKRQEEARRKEEEERKKKEEEAAYAAKYEEELRKKMGL